MGASRLSVQARFVGSEGNELQAAVSGDGPACLLLHGFGDSSAVWVPAVTALEEQWRTIALDLRGHGRSAWSKERRYRTRDHFADVQCVIESAGLTSIVLVGHSLGAGIALRLASDMPHRVAGLVLVDYSPEPGGSALQRVKHDLAESAKMAFSSAAEYAEFLKQRRPLAQRDALAIIARDSLEQGLDGRYRLRLDPGVLERRTADPPSVRPDHWPLFESVQCPTLLVRGEASAALSPSMAREMERRMPCAKLSIVPRAGHAVMLDNPAAFAALLKAFLSALIAPAPSRTHLAVPR
jgi:pimeloyl-ACP methyl ester carboxylesterase